MFHCRITDQSVGLALPDGPTPQGISNFLAELVRRRLVPAWHSRLLWRNIADGFRGTRPELVDRVFRPDFERFWGIAREARPRITDRQARLIFYQLIGQLIFYSHYQAKVLRELGGETYAPELLAEIIDHIALSLTRVLGLPDPTRGGD